MHVAKIVNRRKNKAGEDRVYESVLLRRSYREGARVKHETLANLSALPEKALEVLAASLSGKTVVVGGCQMVCVRGVASD